MVWWVPKQRNFPKIAGSHRLGVYNPCNHQLRGVVAVWWLDEALLHCPSLQASAYAMMAGILEKFRFKQLLIPEFDPEFKGSQARAKSNLSKWYQCRVTKSLAQAPISISVSRCFRNMSKCFPRHDIFGQGQAAMIVSNYQCFCPATYDALCKAGLKQRLLDIATWTDIRPLWKIAAFGKDRTQWWLKNIGIFHRWSRLTSFQLGRHQHHLWHKWYYIDMFTVFPMAYGKCVVCSHSMTGNPTPMR